MRTGYREGINNMNKLSFNQWLVKNHDFTEAELTDENMIKWFDCNEEETAGLIENYNDEYGDYLELIHREEIKVWAKQADEAIAKSREYQRITKLERGIEEEVIMENVTICCSELEMEYNSGDLAKEFGTVQGLDGILYLIEERQPYKQYFRAIAVDLEGELYFIRYKDMTSDLYVVEKF